MNIKKIFLLVVCLSAFTPAISAKEVKLAHTGLNISANLEVAEGSNIKNGVVLMTHGTLAHNKMEIMSTMQDLLKERGVNTLAINLGLGLDNRKGFYDCNTPHSHKHTDALDEIDVWFKWLKEQGVKKVTLLGHSRGGNQTAWFAAERDKAEIKNVVLIAPQTWSNKYADEEYKTRYKKSLQPLLNKAQKLVKADKPDTWMEKTDFIYCKETKVKASSFVSYYRSEPRMDTPYLIPKIGKPVLIVAGTEDTVVKNIDKKVAPLVDDKKVKLLVVDGADHSFRDLYAEDIADAVESFFKE